MKVKILVPLVLADGRVPNVGDIIQVTAEDGRSLIRARYAEEVIENAISKKKQETRGGK